MQWRAVMEPFEQDLVDVLGDRIREDEEFAERIWAALANVEWNKGGEVYGCSFRYAGGLLCEEDRRSNEVG